MDKQPRGPGIGYIAVLVFATLMAWYFLRPLGLQIRGVFQTLVDAFSNR